MKFTQIATAIALGLALTSAAQAATQTSSFKVKIQITGTCAANSFPNAALPAGSDLTFVTQPSATGAVSLLATNDAAAAADSLTVKCTKGTAVTVALQPATVGTAGVGSMSGVVVGNTDTIAYQLIQPTASGSPVAYTVGAIGGTAWGSGTNALSVTGQGMTVGIKLPVAASITAANALDVQADNYSELVTATLTY